MVHSSRLFVGCFFVKQDESTEFLGNDQLEGKFFATLELALVVSEQEFCEWQPRIDKPKMRTMIYQELVETFCPYCGESIQLIVDCSIPYQEYIEDCQVCCRPIQVSATVTESGVPELSVSAENE